MINLEPGAISWDNPPSENKTPPDYPELDDYFDESIEDKDSYEKPESELKDQIDKYLSPQDLEIIDLGLEKIQKELAFRKELPKTIVFLETSARPLYYVLAPLLKKIYLEKGETFPAIKFLTPHKDLWKIQLKIDEIRRMQQEKLDPLHSSFVEYARDSLARNQFSPGTTLEVATQELLDGNIEEAELYLTLSGYKPEELLARTDNLMDSAEQTLDAQLQTLKKTTDNADGHELFFIDDYLNTGDSLDALYDGLVRNEISYSSLFIFAANDTKPIRDEDGYPLYGTLKVIIGKSVNGNQYSGFRYRTNGSFNPWKTYDAKKEQFSYVGTSKTLDRQSAIPVPNTTGLKRTELRQILKKIGTDFVKKRATT